MFNIVLEKKTLSINIKKISVKQFLKKLKKSTQKFYYSPNKIQV